MDRKTHLFNLKKIYVGLFETAKTRLDEDIADEPWLHEAKRIFGDICNYKIVLISKSKTVRPSES